MTPLLFKLAAGLLSLYVGGELMVRGSAALGLRLGMTPLLTGLTIVAFGTSAPELVVSLQAAWRGQTGLAMGNVVGSNIANIALVLGLSTLMRPVEIDSRLVRHDVPIMLVCSLVLVLMLIDHQLSRPEGVALLLGLIAFLVFTVYDSQAPKAAVRREFAEAIPGNTQSWSLAFLMVLTGAVMLIWGGGLFVTGAMGVSVVLGVAPAVVGLSVTAIGTSLPELATSLVAAVRGYGDMAVGNVVGSNIFNILFVLGLTSTVMPLNRGGVSILDLVIMLAFSVVSMRLLASHAVMERWEGAVLVSGFLAYMAWLFA